MLLKMKIISCVMDVSVDSGQEIVWYGYKQTVISYITIYIMLHIININMNSIKHLETT